MQELRFVWVGLVFFAWSCAESHENRFAEGNVDSGVGTPDATGSESTGSPIECEVNEFELRVYEAPNTGSASVTINNETYRILSATAVADTLTFVVTPPYIDPPPISIEISRLPPETAATIASKWETWIAESGQALVLLSLLKSDNNWRVRFELSDSLRPQTLFEAGRIQVNRVEDEYSPILRFDEADIDVGATNFADACTSGERVHRYVYVDPLARGQEEVPSQGGGDTNRVTLELGSTAEVTSAYQDRFNVTAIEARSGLGTRGQDIAIGALIW